MTTRAWARDLLTRSGSHRNAAALVDVLPLGLFLALFVTVVAVQGGFSGELAMSVVETTVPLILVAAGQTLVVMTRGIDLSVGGVFSLTTALLATKATDDGSVVVWLVIALAVATLCGAINGILVAFTSIQPFIVTLATWSILSGVALLVLPTEGGGIAPSLTGVLSGDIVAPKSLIVVLLVIGAWFVLRRSRIGTDILAVGSSEHAAALNGVPVRRTKVAVYALSALLTALGAVFYVAVVTFAGSPVAGESFVLLSIAAVVIGGTSLRGGRGSVAWTVVGALSLSLIAQVVFFVGLESYWSQLAQGLIILAAVGIFATAELVTRSRASQKG